MASSSSDPDSLVTLRFHDFRVERMRHWWTLLGEDDHADIVGIFGKFPPFMRLQVDRGLLEALASFWDPTHCCFSIGEVDLVPTMEEYAELFQLASPFSETPAIPIQGPRSNRCLEKYLGLTTAVLRPEIARPEATWRKANISLDLLTKYFSRSAFPARLARDFIAGKKEWKKFRINAFKIAFAGIFLFPTSAGRIDLGVIPIVFSEGRKPCTPRAAPSCAAHDGPARVVVLPRGSLILPRQQPLESSSISVRVPFFIRFSGAVLEVFWNSNWVMRHIVGKLSTSSFQRYKVCANRSSDEGVMAPGSRGIGAVFVHSSGEDSDQTGDAFGEPRVPRRSRSHYLSNAPGLADQLVASRKDSAREGGSCAAYFCKVPDSRESELGLVRYGPASRVHRGVFGPFEGSFPIRIPADPDKFLAIREFHVVHGCVLFPMCPGSQINLLRVRKTLCASAATSALHRGELGFARYDPANGGRRNVPYAKGGGQFDPVFGLVNSPVKPWSNLVNLGQTWSDLVKALQTLGSVPRTSFQGFLGKADPSRAGNSSVKPRSNFGQP
uniref:DUF7745 domain-containing protein n=1 Tax=Fagus sylvatica TaxID=28930 RepID=A0A2N9I3E0_FAGSY